MNLEKYIADLLHDHDMVIVPGFGALIGRRRPARIQKDKGFFRPPRKELTFNPLLRHDDGVLVEAVAADHHIPYEEASRLVKAAVDRWWQSLKERGFLRLDQTGFFHYKDGKLLFTPYAERNFLPEAYGLYTFYRPAARPSIEITAEEAVTPEFVPVSAEETAEPKAAPAKEVSTPVPSYPKYPRTRPAPAPRRLPAWAGYAAAAVLFFLLAWGGFRWHAGSHTADTHVQTAGYGVPLRFPGIEIPVESPSETVAAESNAYTYYIIIGAFRDPANARELVNRLRRRGIPALTAGTNPRGLHYVAYGAVTDPAEAESLLARVRPTYKGAWVLKKKAPSAP